MQLVLHTGAHFTQEERLIKTVLRNKDAFASAGVHVPPTTRYRPLVRDTLNAMHKTPANPGARKAMLDLMLEDRPVERLVLSDANFFRTASTAIQKGVLYPAGAARLSHMAAIFPEATIEIFLGIRNPGAMIPLFFHHAADITDAGFWGGAVPLDIRWSSVVEDIQEQVPRAQITLWCAEDLPLIWGAVIRAILGFPEDQKITGGFDLLSSIMSKEGMERFRSYMRKNPELTEVQKRAAIAAFLDKFALDDEIEEEVNMPGWSSGIVEALTEAYDADVAQLSSYPNVRVIMP